MAVRIFVELQKGKQRERITNQIIGRISIFKPVKAN
jgi:hypothetical protein